MTNGLTNGYGVDPSELASHAKNVRSDVGDVVGKAHNAAQYEPGLIDMGILGFVITQLIDMLNDTDRQIMLLQDFGEALTDRVEHAGRTYEDIEAENLEIINDIDRAVQEQQREDNPPGPRR